VPAAPPRATPPQHAARAGCGHIRLMMQTAPINTVPDYSVDMNSASVEACTAANVNNPNCINSKTIGQRIISDYWNYWW
jgi:hypothetical protein